VAYRKRAPDVAASPSDREALIRIAREAVTNAAKHGNATRVKVELTENGERFLRITDNGCGFDPAEVGPGGFAEQRLGPEVDLPLLDEVVFGKPLGHGQHPLPDSPERFAGGRVHLRGQLAGGVHVPRQFAHEEVVVFAEAFDRGAHLLRCRRAFIAFVAARGREQRREEVQVLGPDVDGEARPQVVEFLERRASAAAVERLRQVAEECVYFGVVAGEK
jgi:hypothetical protein